MPELQDFVKYDRWLFETMERIWKIMGEGSKSWEPLSIELEKVVGKDVCDLLDCRPTADYLLYHSRGNADNGRVKDFIDNFEKYKELVEKFFETYKV